MALADVCHDTDVRSRDFTQTVHLAKIADSHLENGDLVLLCQAEDREGQAQFIVKVSEGL